MPEQVIVDQVVGMLRGLDAWPRLRVLDLSCGEGAVLEVLHGEGCAVEGTHFREDDYILKQPRPVLKQVPIHPGVDLTQPLPFGDQQFDVVIATEVIEHLPSHSAFVREASRVIKPGGYLVVTTPNIHRLVSRFQFALTGQHELRSARLGWEVPADALYSTHHNPVYLPVFHALLHQNELRIEQAAFTTCRIADLLLLPLLPIVWLGTALEARHAIKRSREGGRDLLRWLCDVRLLFSHQLVLLARKDVPAAPAAT
jgi:SAM-dependent methyltransferase